MGYVYLWKLYVVMGSSMVFGCTELDLQPTFIIILFQMFNIQG